MFAIADSREKENWDGELRPRALLGCHSTSQCDLLAVAAIWSIRNWKRSSALCTKILFDKGRRQRGQWVFRRWFAGFPSVLMWLLPVDCRVSHSGWPGRRIKPISTNLKQRLPKLTGLRSAQENLPNPPVRNVTNPALGFPKRGPKIFVMLGFRSGGNN